jgi:deferrochelatase/peroxidase EfeB
MSAADAREWVAAKLIGRWRNGSPLEISPDGPDPATCESEGFGYALDPDGMKCPFAAHTRVSNPRDQELFPTDEPVPRIIRRGAPYGAPVDVDPNADRGLIGLFLCGALAAQFELIYAWMNTNNFSDVFSPNFDTQDAMLANRQVAGADTSFTMPTPHGPIQVTLPQFLTTRGTAYCLLPSMSSLRAIAEQTV